jgi:hypothetical protein
MPIILLDIDMVDRFQTKGLAALWSKIGQTGVLLNTK